MCNWFREQFVIHCILFLNHGFKELNITINFPLGAGTSPTAIAALTSTVNRTTTNLQPLVPIGTQLQQQPFQVRMVQFPQQGGPTQIQPTIVQSPRGATPVQINTQQAQVVQGLQQVGIICTCVEHMKNNNKISPWKN